MIPELEAFLIKLRDDIRSGHRPTLIKSPFGDLGVVWDYDPEFGTYATVGFNLPDGIYAEIEDGTYGQLQGFRIYTS